LIGVIALREIQENVLSLRFALMCVAVIGSFVVGGISQVSDFKQRSGQYLDGRSRNERALADASSRLSNLLVHEQIIEAGPSELMFVSRGDMGAGGISLAVSPSGLYGLGGSSSKARRDFAGAGWTLDWEFIITRMLTFLAVLVTYAGLTGEKERGTLRLIGSSPVRRSHVFLGKFLGSFSTVLIPLGAGCLACLAIVSLTQGLSGPSAWGRVGLIFVISAVFLALWVALGLTASGLCRGSSSSLVLLMFVWLLFCIVIPQCGEIVSSIASKVPTPRVAALRAGDAIEAVEERHSDENWGSVNFNEPWSPQTALWVEVQNEMSEAAEKVYREYGRASIKQARFAQSVELLSPVGLFVGSLRTITGSGLDSLERFLEALEIYQRQLVSFIKQKDAEDPDTPNLLHEYFMSGEPVDPQSVPRFSMPGRGSRAALTDASGYAGGLLISWAALFVLGLLLYGRYDMR